MAAELLGAFEPFKEIVLSVVLTLTSTFSLWLFRAKVKLTWGSTSVNFHNFKIDPNAANVSIWTEKFYVQNLGKKSASGIELVFSSIMTSYNVWPPREHESKLLQNGQFILNFSSVAPSELLIIDTIDITGNNPRLLTVNCPEAVTKEVSFLPQRRSAKIMYWLIGYLMLAGLFASFYFVVVLLLEISK